MAIALGSPVESPWPRRVGLAVLLGLLAAVYAGTRPRGPGLVSLGIAAPQTKWGVEISALEAAMPAKAWFLAGAINLPESWAQLEATQFYQTLRDGLPAQTDLGAAVKLFGARAVLGLYTLGGITRDWAVLAEAAPGASLADLRARLRVPYAARVGDVWILSSSARLGAEAAERLAAHEGVEEWITKAFAHMPDYSTFYAAVNFQALRPIDAHKALAYDKKHPWLWTSGGVRLGNGLLAESFAGPREGAKGFFRDPPQRPRMPFPPGDDAAVFASFIFDLRRGWRDTFAAMTADERQTADRMLDAVRQRWDLERRLIPFLGDEAGVYIGRNPAGAVLPPAAVFVRMRYAWLFRLGLWKALKDGGWKQDRGLWVHAVGGGLVPADVALTFHRGFVIIGTREGVEALRRPAGSGGRLAETFKSVHPPEAVNAVFAVDVGGVAAGLEKSFDAWRPKRRVAKGAGDRDWVRALGLVPPYAGYVVNVSEGGYYKFHAALTDRPAPEWRRGWAALFPARGGGGLPLFGAAPEPAHVRVENGGTGTSISIRGAAAPSRREGSTLARPVTVSRQSLLRDPDWMVRRDAARALGETGGAKDIAALQPLLKDRRPEVRAAAQRAIQTLRRRSAPARR